MHKRADFDYVTFGTYGSRARLFLDVPTLRARVPRLSRRAVGRQAIAELRHAGCPCLLVARLHGVNARERVS